MKKNHEQLIKEFCDDCLFVLKEYDEKIREKIINGVCADFYNNDYKGIGLYSVTEPILKYLIFTNLLDKYFMWSEYAGYYENGQLLDMGIYFGDEEEVEPNIAIEMKWTYITKEGYFYKNWENSIKTDLVKLHRCKKISNKYFMQFMMIPVNHFNVGVDSDTLVKNLTDQCNDIIDHRIMWKKSVHLVYRNSFQTKGASLSDYYDFTILLWHIN